MNEKIRQRLESSFEIYDFDFKDISMQLMMIATANEISEDDVLNYMNVRIKGEMIEIEKNGIKQKLIDAKNTANEMFNSILRKHGIDPERFQ